MQEMNFTVGKVVNTHGIRGELKVWPETDFPEERFAKGAELLLTPPAGGEPLRVHVAFARSHKNLFIVKLREFDNINDVEKFKGWTLKADTRIPLGEDEFYFADIIGCTVRSEDGEEIGEVTEILRPGANDVWVVRRKNGKPAYIPYIDDVVLNVDVPSKVVTIHVMEGLLE